MIQWENVLESAVNIGACWYILTFYWVSTMIKLLHFSLYLLISQKVFISNFTANRRKYVYINLLLSGVDVIFVYSKY